MKLSEHVREAHGEDVAAAPSGVQVEIYEWKRQRQEVHDLRKKHWPTHKKPPKRFTGLADLPEDAKAAERAHPAGHFNRYRVRVLSMRNLNVHGSAVAVRHVDYGAFPMLSAYAFAEAAHFALVAAEMVVRHNGGVWGDTAQGVFDEARNESGVSLGHLMDELPDPNP